jgi:hypothetical protein
MKIDAEKELEMAVIAAKKWNIVKMLEFQVKNQAGYR